MFDYESDAGEVFLKDEYHRLKSYEWTNTGIQLKIPNINKESDLGEYIGEVAIENYDSQQTIAVKEIFGQSFICVGYFYKC